MASLVEKAATKSKFGNWCVGILIILGLGPKLSLFNLGEEIGLVVEVEVMVVQVDVKVDVVLIMTDCDGDS